MEPALTTPVHCDLAAATGPSCEETFVERYHMKLIHHPGAHLHQAMPMPKQLPQVPILCGTDIGANAEPQPYRRHRLSQHQTDLVGSQTGLGPGSERLASSGWEQRYHFGGKDGRGGSGRQSD